MAELNPAPTLESLLSPHVLMHAWKKANRYIRRHNWVADVLEIDIAAIQLPSLVKRWVKELESNNFGSDPLRLVAAPKRGEWNISHGHWKPKQKRGYKEKTRPGLRPLAHPSIRDQVLSTAFLICLSDRIETLQGDPTRALNDARGREVVSYGNRLLCDRLRLLQRFRWGNSETYRKWFTDYRAFVERPKVVIHEHFGTKNNWAEIRADLSQFYDRVRPELLHRTIKRLLGNETESAFLRTFARLFDWQWHTADVTEAQRYATTQKVPGFDRVALPQGLVASGFFANAVLIDFDAAVRSTRNEEIRGRSWRLVDYARYVDDLRLVIEVESDDAEGLKENVSEWLQGVLRKTAPDLLLSAEKTEITLGRDPGRLIPVSDTMKLVQQNVSGPLALSNGQETLELLEGLLAAQPTQSVRPDEEAEDGSDSLPIEDILHDQLDVRPDTLARFSAHRWRTTFRNLRPICEEDGVLSATSPTKSAPTRGFLDRRAEVFCRNLIRKWVVDPSNVRLLRIAFDINPSAESLNAVVKLLLQHLGPVRPDKQLMLVCSYIAAELFRAGATETAHTSPDELPAFANVSAYRETLAEFAARILRRRRLPWYVQQQAVLFLAFARKELPTALQRLNDPTFGRYAALHALSMGQLVDVPAGEFIALSIVLCQTAGELRGAASRVLQYARSFPERSADLFELLLSEAGPLASAVWDAASPSEHARWGPHFAAYGYLFERNFPQEIERRTELNGKFNVMDVASAAQSPLRHEYGALHLIRGLLNERPKMQHGALTPWRIDVECEDWSAVTSSKGLIPDFIKVHINSPPAVTDRRYEMPPSWGADMRWRIEVGQILRAVLTGNHDFTLRGPKTEENQRYPLYRGVTSSFEHRRHGLVAGREALGLDWLPVSSWIGNLISTLLKWPGSKDNGFFPSLHSAEGLLALVEERTAELKSLYGKASETALIPISVSLGKRHLEASRVRVAVVQSALPKDGDFKAKDVQLNDPAYRRLHRRHLRQVLDGLTAMLQVRRTHLGEDAGMELVVFPELAVHPDDLRPIIERFADQTRCIVFCGLVFHQVPFAGGAVVNSGMWVIPDRTRESRNIQRYEQGKLHLTPWEKSHGISAFRPCQWILDYKNPRTGDTLWRMTASICYDATDLKLAADLRDRTDAYIVAALNKDVGTFDSMAQALHYHMFQHVIVANCGQYGGSVVQAPFKESFDRTVLHHHGHEQAIVSFFELDLKTYRAKAASSSQASKKRTPSGKELKTPPAGYGGRIY